MKTPRNEEKRKEIVELRINNPCFSLQDIGDRAGGLSRERVRQILSSEGIETKRTIFNNRICPQCGKGFRISPGLVNTTHYIFCSDECRHNYYWGVFSCDECGKLFERKKIEVINNHRKYETEDHHIFCDQHCHGMWLAKTYGKGYDSENYKTVQVVCNICNTIIERKVWQIKAHDRAGYTHYICSPKCRLELAHSIQRKKKIHAK